MTDKLLPCPFCCGEPKIIRRAGAFGVKCTCDGKRFLHTYGKTEEAAVTSWNTRDFSPMSVAAAAVAAIDPALIGIAEEMKESGGHWMPCTGCYDTEDGYPTQKYAYSPALQTDIGCGCHECGGLGAVWWHMTDEELAQFEKECAGIDNEPAQTCPICAQPLNDDDICATDIEMGICHAACLEGSPVVDLNTGAEVDGPVGTYRYSDTAPTEPNGA